MIHPGIVERCVSGNLGSTFYKSEKRLQESYARLPHVTGFSPPLTSIMGTTTKFPEEAGNSKCQMDAKTRHTH